MKCFFVAVDRDLSGDLCLFRKGVPEDGVRETCASGAGSLVLEFGLLSRLLGDPVYENRARRAVDVLWGLRSEVTGLTGGSPVGHRQVTRLQAARPRRAARVCYNLSHSQMFGVWQN